MSSHLKTQLKTALTALCMVALLAPNGVALAAQADAKAQAEYDAGHTALQARDWSSAVAAFKRAENDAQLAAAALYWQASALASDHKKSQAQAALERLLKKHPQSNWADDARVMLQQLSENKGVNEAAMDEEMRLYAVQSILLNNPEKGLPMVMELLRDGRSEAVRMNALQLLGMSGHPQSTQALLDFLHSGPSDNLARNAVQMLAFQNDPATREELQKLYQEFDSKAMRSALIEGMIHQNNSTALMQLFRVEKDPELLEQMVRVMGITGEAEPLKEMLRNPPKGLDSAVVLEALALTGDGESLLQFIRASDDAEQRAQAITMLMMAPLDDLPAHIESLYNEARSDEEKAAVVTLTLSTNVPAEQILRMYRNEQDTDRKGTLITALMSHGQSDALRSLYAEENDAELKRHLFHMLAMTADPEDMLSMYRQSSDEEQRNDILHSLAVTDAEVPASMLTDHFMQGDDEARNVVLQYHLIRQDAEGLKRLLKLTPDVERKKEIIQMLGILGSDDWLDQLGGDQ